MTEPSWTMNDTDRQIVSGPYAAPEVFVPASLGLTARLELSASEKRAAEAMKAWVNS